MGRGPCFASPSHRGSPHHLPAAEYALRGRPAARRLHSRRPLALSHDADVATHVAHAPARPRHLGRYRHRPFPRRSLAPERCLAVAKHHRRRRARRQDPPRFERQGPRVHRGHAAPLQGRGHGDGADHRARRRREPCALFGQGGRGRRVRLGCHGRRRGALAVRPPIRHRDLGRGEVRRAESDPSHAIRIRQIRAAGRAGRRGYAHPGRRHRLHPLRPRPLGRAGGRHGRGGRRLRGVAGPDRHGRGRSLDREQGVDSARHRESGQAIPLPPPQSERAAPPERRAQLDRGAGRHRRRRAGPPVARPALRPRGGPLRGQDGARDWAGELWYVGGRVRRRVHREDHRVPRHGQGHRRVPPPPPRLQRRPRAPHGQQVGRRPVGGVARAHRHGLVPPRNREGTRGGEVDHGRE
mmetsp:Transcript_31811/g.73470  ORF Transcript_31811/g.73470 Transcript_31811/m.73470 type:complete len:410 (+) Transcript_31811:2-1231(+)